MELVISDYKDVKHFDAFVDSYLRSYIYDLFKESYEDKKAEVINKEFNIDSYSLLDKIFKNLIVSRVNDKCTVSINKNIKINGNSIEYYARLINYGNRTVKGYNLIEVIFEYVAEHINTIYIMWLEGLNER